MQEVMVKKDDVLDTLRENREAHRAKFERALELYAEELLAWHQEQIEAIKSGTARKPVFSKPTPEDYTAEYDRVIRMMELSVDNQIKLTASDFDQYVMDRWGWQGRFAANTESYLG